GAPRETGGAEVKGKTGGPGPQTPGQAGVSPPFGVGGGVMLSFCLFPGVWQLLTALNPPAELVSLPPFFPTAPTLDHFRTVFAERPFAHILFNSMVVALCTTGLCLVVGTPAAFALAKLRVPGQRLILLGTLR